MHAAWAPAEAFAPAACGGDALQSVMGFGPKALEDIEAAIVKVRSDICSSLSRPPMHHTLQRASTRLIGPGQLLYQVIRAQMCAL